MEKTADKAIEALVRVVLIMAVVVIVVVSAAFGAPLLIGPGGIALAVP